MTYTVNEVNLNAIIFVELSLCGQEVWSEPSMGARMQIFMCQQMDTPDYKNVFTKMLTDRRTDGRTDRQTDRQTDGRTDRQTDGQTNLLYVVLVGKTFHLITNIYIRVQFLFSKRGACFYWVPCFYWDIYGICLISCT